MASVLCPKQGKIAIKSNILNQIPVKDFFTVEILVYFHKKLNSSGELRWVEEMQPK